jgi:hypothetical protein
MVEGVRIGDEIRREGIEEELSGGHAALPAGRVRQGCP